MPLLVASTLRDHMSQSIGVPQTVQIVSSAVGPIIGGLLADWIGIRKTCMVSAALTALAVIMIDRLCKDPESATAAAGGARERGISFGQATAVPSFGIMLSVLFFVNFVSNFWEGMA